jgi:beta-phosphoglucomutase
MKLNAVLFDLDGVLVDTARFHYLGWKRIADELGLSFSQQDNERLKGVDRRNSFLNMVNGRRSFTEKEITDYCERKNRYYIEYIGTIRPDDVLPGINRLLGDIEHSMMRKAVCSTSRNAKPILQAAGLMDRFDAVVDGHDIRNGKPDPEVFLRAAQTLDELPENCLVIEDAETGVEAGKKAGMKVVGVGSPEILKKADLVVPGLADVSMGRLRGLFAR